MILASVAGGALVGSLVGTRSLPFTVDVGGRALNGATLAIQLIGMLTAVGITCLFRWGVDGRSVASLGLEREGRFRELAVGFGLGALLMGLVLAAELLLGGYRVRNPGPTGVHPTGLLIALGGLFAAFALVAFEEELIARGYLLQNLREGWGTLPAVLLSSVVFALAHLGNPGASLPSSIGIFTAGLQLACAYLVSQRLWVPIGLHWSWNFFQGPVFGFPVSGIRAPSLLELEPVGPGYLTGGEFGPEASLIGLGANLIGVAALVAWSRR